MISVTDANLAICWLMLKCKHTLINYSWIIRKPRERSRKSRSAWKQFYCVTLKYEKNKWWIMIWLTPRAGTIRRIQCSDLLLGTILTGSYTRPCLKTFVVPFSHANPTPPQGLQAWFKSGSWKGLQSHCQLGAYLNFLFANSCGTLLKVYITL